MCFSVFKIQEDWDAVKTSASVGKTQVAPRACFAANEQFVR
jgi:hypothetical protein